MTAHDVSSGITYSLARATEDLAFLASPEAARSATLTLSAAVTLRQYADDLVSLYVQAARSKGISWAAIGDELGISRQAAWERFRAVSKE